MPPVEWGPAVPHISHLNTFQPPIVPASRYTSARRIPAEPAGASRRFVRLAESKSASRDKRAGTSTVGSIDFCASFKRCKCRQAGCPTTATRTASSCRTLPCHQPETCHSHPKPGRATITSPGVSAAPGSRKTPPRPPWWPWRFPEATPRRRTCGVPPFNTAFAQSSRDRATLGPLSQLPGDRASAVPFQLPQMLPVHWIRISGTEEVTSGWLTVYIGLGMTHS